MAFTVTAGNSCKLISIRANNSQGITDRTVVVTNIATGIQAFSGTIYYNNNGLGNLVIPMPDQSGSGGGLYRVCLGATGASNPMDEECRPILLHCDLDCCLTKLTNELIDCSCDCPRCAASLAKAQKIFLLLKTAQSSVELASNDTNNEAFYLDMQSKYIKAKEICDNSCGCNC
jgi:hypothetical protein